MRTTPEDSRTPAQIREHYEIERALAARLRTATRSERRSLYTSLYDELYRRVPHHPQLVRKASIAESSREVSRKMKLVRRYLEPTTSFLEIGPGDCAFSFEAARFARSVVAVDVSNEIARRGTVPTNFRLVISDGSSVPLADGSVDVAYSNQLMEHLHPDDAAEQLQNVYRVLSPHGRYICITPNRIAGPHDVSQHFDEVATGFHLREYTYAELVALLREVGFRSIDTYVGGKGIYVRVPMSIVFLCERLLGSLPRTARRRCARSLFGRAVLGINLVAFKQSA